MNGALVFGLSIAVTLGGGCGADAPASPSPAPGASQTFEIDLPVAVGDTATAAYGIWPFGVHGSSHALDGHPGFDVEFRVGASVRVAAAGTIQSVSPDPNGGGRFSIRISHAVASGTFATDYTNIESLAAGIGGGAAVVRGQALGLAGVQTQMIGASQVTWAMTHFQLNDFTRNDGTSNPNAVSPESMLSPAARTFFAGLWANAAYTQELTEPFATNPRSAVFPLVRRWTTTLDPLVAHIDITHADAASPEQTYEIWSAAGTRVESGTVTMSRAAEASAIDFTPAGRPARLGLCDIINQTMRLSLGAPGAARPASLANAVVYSTP